MSLRGRTAPRRLTRAVLRRYPLPALDPHGDKEARGRVVIIGGAPLMPGPVMLAAEAALRAGAGKVQVITCAQVAPLIAAMVPELMVIPAAEGSQSAFSPRGMRHWLPYLDGAHCVVVGPGMVQEAVAGRVLCAVAKRARAPPPPATAPRVLTPHAGASSVSTSCCRLRKRLESPHA